MAFDSAQFLRNPIRFDRVDTMMPNVMSTLDAENVAESGRLAGLSVIVETDVAAELQDSMEELSMLFEEKAAKKLSDRKLGETRSQRTSYAFAVEHWSQVMPDLPKQEAIERFIHFLRQLQTAGNLPNAQQFLSLLGQLSQDPSLQFAMLDILEQAFRSDESDLRSLVTTTRETLMREKGSEIQAGINLASEINVRATSAEEMRQLRDLYRSEILGFKSPQDCFRSILASYGADRIQSAIEFLTKGCGTDLASATPSMDAVALRRVLLDLQCVQVLQTVLDSMSGLSTRMVKEFGEKMLLGQEAMTGRVIEFTEKSYVSTDQLAAFIAACGVMQLLARMDFTREMMNIFRKLSPRLFATEEDRDRLVEASQEHLDALIAEEIDADEGEDNS